MNISESSARIVLADKVDGLVCKGLVIVCLSERVARDHLEAWRKCNKLLILRARALEVVDLRVRRDGLKSRIERAVVIHWSAREESTSGTNHVQVPAPTRLTLRLPVRALVDRHGQRGAVAVEEALKAGVGVDGACLQ